MKHLLLLTFVSLMLILARMSLHAQGTSVVPEAASHFQIASILVAKPLSSEDEQYIPGQYGFIGGTGTTLQVIAVVPNMIILDIDYAKTNLADLEDDQGFDLTKSFRNADGSIDYSSGAGPSSGPISSNFDQHSDEIGVSIHSNDIPNHNATKIHLKVRLALLCGADPQHFQASKIDIKPGTAIQIGPVRLTLDSVSYDSFHKSIGYVFSSPNDLNILTSLQFLSPSGAVLKPQMSWSGPDQSGITTFNETFSSSHKLPWVGVEATYYSHVQTVPVDIDQTVGLGL